MILERNHTVFLGYDVTSFVLNRESCEDRAANLAAQGLPNEETLRALASWPGMEGK